MHVPTHVKVLAGIGGAATLAITSDRVFNGGLETGWFVPAASSALAGGAFALSAATSPAWRFSGAPALHATTRGAILPLLGVAAGSAAGLGLALLTDRLLPGGDATDRTARGAHELLDDVERRTSSADEIEAANAEKLHAATERRDAARAELDALIAANGGTLGADGLLGEGRLDLGGRSPAAAARLILEAYGTTDGHLDEGDLRVAGPATFTIDRLYKAVQASGYHRNEAGLTRWLSSKVDTEQPKDVIDDREAVEWQVGPFGEERATQGVDATSGASR